MTVERGGGPRPVDQAFLLLDLRRQRGQRVVLRLFARRSRRASRSTTSREQQRAGHRRGAVRANRSCRRARSATRHARASAPASSASTTRMMVTPLTASPVEDRALDRRRAAPAGSSDACTLSRPSGGRSSSACGSSRPYAATTPRSAFQARERVEEVRHPSASSAAGSARPRRARVPYGRVRDLLPASARPIGLRDDADHLVVRRQQRIERRHGEGRRAEEGDAERHQTRSPLAGTPQCARCAA